MKGINFPVFFRTEKLTKFLGGDQPQFGAPSGISFSPFSFFRYTWIVGRAERKTPIAIYIGNHDQFFPVESVRKTRDLLLKAGFPVHYVEMDHHDHNYYARSDEINADAWKFLKENALPAGGSEQQVK